MNKWTFRVIYVATAVSRLRFEFTDIYDFIIWPHDGKYLVFIFIVLCTDFYTYFFLLMYFPYNENLLFKLFNKLIYSTEHDYWSQSNGRRNSGRRSNWRLPGWQQTKQRCNMHTLWWPFQWPLQYGSTIARITQWRRFIAFIKATKRRHQTSTHSDITQSDTPTPTPVVPDILSWKKGSSWHVGP